MVPTNVLLPTPTVDVPSLKRIFRKTTFPFLTAVTLETEETPLVFETVGVSVFVDDDCADPLAIAYSPSSGSGRGLRSSTVKS